MTITTKPMNKKFICKVMMVVKFAFTLIYLLKKFSGSLFEPEINSTIHAASVQFKSKTNFNRTKIPLILHQTWKSTKLSFLLKPWIQSCILQNDDFEYWFWTDNDIRQFILSRYPHFINLFDSYPTDGYRADAFR